MLYGKFPIIPIGLLKLLNSNFKKSSSIIEFLIKG